jgi:hypothetical protein
MNRTARPQVRRLAVTLVLAGTAALGTVAVAPIASAAPVAQDGPAYVIDGNGNGPDYFVVTATGRIPVFFCEDVKPGKDGVIDPKDVAKAEEKAAKEAQKAADEAAKNPDKAAKDADKDAEKAAKDGVDKVMKQHNICLSVSPGGSRF